MMKIKLAKLIKRDLIFGFENNKYKFIGVALVFIAVVWINIVNLQGEAFALGMSSKDINFIDLFFSIFKGIDYNVLPLPVNWVLIHIYITYLIGSYCYDDLSEDSAHIIVKMGHRRDIWISKVIWMIATVIAFYLILLAIIFVFSMTMFEISFEWSNFSSESILGTIQSNYSSIQFILLTISIYMLSSITMSILQMLISFILKPTYIYLINISILVISLYLKQFVIPIQGSLILRQNIFDSMYSINPVNTIVYNLVVFISIFIIGSVYIRKFDMLVSQKTD